MVEVGKDLGQNCGKNVFPRSNIYWNLRIFMHRGKNYCFRGSPAKADKHSTLENTVRFSFDNTLNVITWATCFDPQRGSSSGQHNNESKNFGT
jgi:hypothetical protein